VTIIGKLREAEIVLAQGRKLTSNCLPVARTRMGSEACRQCLKTRAEYRRGAILRTAAS
jgi:hypothetical protein